jgi:hypothetical protein
MVRAADKRHGFFSGQNLTELGHDNRYKNDIEVRVNT